MTLGRVNVINWNLATTFKMVWAVQEASLGRNLRSRQRFSGGSGMQTLNPYMSWRRLCLSGWLFLHADIWVELLTLMWLWRILQGLLHILQSPQGYGSANKPFPVLTYCLSSCKGQRTSGHTKLWYRVQSRHCSCLPHSGAAFSLSLSPNWAVLCCHHRFLFVTSQLHFPFPAWLCPCQLFFPGLNQLPSTPISTPTKTPSWPLSCWQRVPLAAMWTAALSLHCHLPSPCPPGRPVPS